MDDVYGTMLEDMVFWAEEGMLDDDIEEEVASMLSNGETDKMPEDDDMEEEVF